MLAIITTVAAGARHQYLLCYLLPQNCFCLWVDIRNIAGYRVHHTVLLEPQDETLVGL